MGRNMSALSKAIKDKTGMSTTEFAMKVLGLKYSTFTYRVREESLKVSDYEKMMEATGLSFDELRGRTSKPNGEPVRVQEEPKKVDPPGETPFRAEDIDFPT